MKFLKKASIIFDRIIDLSAILAGILLIFVTLSVCAEVFLRYFLGRPTVWVVEIAGYTLLYITFLVVAWVQRKEGHVKMDLVFNQLNPIVQSVVNVITSLICTAACFILTWYGAKTTLYLFQTGYPTPTPLRIPKFIIIVIIFVGSLLLFIQFLRTTYVALRAIKHDPGKLNMRL
jgi:TRAP-type C4-dicarboxylate transport system permease small subunit